MSRPARVLYPRLLGFVRPYWRVFAGSLVAMVVLAATEPAIPALLKPTLDGSFVDKDVGAVSLMAVLLVLLFLVRGLAGYASAMTLAWVAGKVVMNLREAAFARVLGLPQTYLDRHPSGQMVSRISYDAAQVTEAATQVLTAMVRDSLSVFGLIAWMFYLDWTLTLVALVAAPFVVLVSRHFSRRLRAMSHRVQDSMGDITHLVEEVLTGQQVVRVFGGEDSERERFHGVANWVRRYGMKFASAAAATAPIAQFITAIALAAILYLAAHRSASGALSIGSFVSFFTAMAMLFSPLKRLTGINGPLQRGLAAAESIFTLVDETPERDEGTRVLRGARGRVEFRKVSFSYGHRDEHPALHEVDLVIEPGETLALVGPSGSGKSTLAKLLPRFYAPGSGQILVDGVDVTEYTLASLRSNIALVSQDVVLFDDTVAANIAYGLQRGSSLKAVREAARAAHALEFIEALPQGFETRVGESGQRLSGGQRQRIAIARAFLKNARVLILDEATSSLDTEAERHIQAALENLRRGRTTLVIAHRLSTIERADRIVVLSGGRVVESGTHTELLDKNSLYAGLYRFQFRRFADDTASAAR